LFNKVAVITGAGSGIGRATALLFAKKGAKVVVVDLDSKEGSKTVDSIEGHGGEATLVVADVSKASNVQRMVKTILELYGRLDILVNNEKRRLTRWNGKEYSCFVLKTWYGS